MFKIFILVFLYCSTYATPVDMYYVNKAIKKVNYLSDVSKLSLNSSTNPFISNNNILTARNSRLVDMISNEQLNQREQEVLFVIDKIILNETRINRRYSCLNISRHNFSRNGEFINPRISVLECNNLNIKFQDFYQVGVSSIQSVDNTRLGQFRQRIDLDDTLENKSYFTSKIKKEIYDKKQIEEKINFLNDQELLALSQKFTNPTSRTFTDYTLIMNTIRTRANNLLDNGIGDIANLNIAIANSNSYVHRTFTQGENPQVTINFNQISEINRRLNGLNIALIKVNDDINSTELGMVDKQTAEQDYANMGYGEDEPPRQGLIEALAADFQKLDDFRTLRDEINSEIATLEGFLTDPASIPNNSFTTHLLSLIQNRIIENILYNKIVKINTIQRNINKFIINNSKNLIFENDITAQNYIDYDNLNTSQVLWWPNMFDNRDVDITFEYDEVNYVIRYTNLFSNEFVTSVLPFNASVRRIFRENVELPTDAIIDNNFNLILPLELKTIRYISNKNQIAPAHLHEFTDLNSACTSQNSLYQPNSHGGFKLYLCNGVSSWDDVKSEKFYDTNNRNEKFRDTNISYGIFLNDMGGDIFYTIDGSGIARKIITQGGNFMRIEK